MKASTTSAADTIGGDPFNAAAPAKVATGTEIAAKINCGDFRASYDRTEMEDGFHGKLVIELMRLGWKHYQSHSRCTKASSEDHMEKDGRRVEIISAYFMGFFTQVRA